MTHSGNPDPSALKTRVGDRFAQDYLLTFTTNAAIAVIGVGSGAIAARLLLPAGRGQLASIQLWAGFLAVVATFGMPEAITYFTARYRDRSREYLTSALVLSLIASVPIGMAGFALLPLLLRAHGQGVVTYARFYLLFIPVYALVFLPAQAIRGVRQFVMWNLLRVVPSLVWLGVLVAFFIDRRQSAAAAPPGDIADVYLVALGVSSLAILGVSLRQLAGRMTPRPSNWPSLIRFGLPVLGATLPVTLSLRLDQLVMTVVIAPSQLGIYVVAVGWSGAALPVLNSLGSLVLPRIAESSDRELQRALVTRVCRTAVLLTLAVMVPLFAITPVGVRFLFGPSFTSAVPSAYLLLLASGFLGISYILTESLLGLGRTGGPLRAQTLGFVATGASLAILLPLWGIFGAAASSLIGYATNCAVLLHEARRATGATYGELCVARREDASALLAVAKKMLSHRRR